MPCLSIPSIISSLISCGKRKHKVCNFPEFDILHPTGVPRNFVRGGVQQIQLRTEDRDNGDLGAVAPQSGVLEAAVNWYKKCHFV